MFEGITKAVAAVGRVVRREPVRKQPSIGDLFPWIIGALNSNKAQVGSWQTYYQAMDQEWVSACISAIVAEVLGANFNIQRDDEEQNNPANESYLLDLYQRPGAELSTETYTTFMWKIWLSLLGTGDVFIEACENEAQSGLTAGLFFIQPHRMAWYSETSQWGYVGSEIRFEDNELIHIAMPDPWNDHWGKSPIDNIARSLTLDLLAWQFNKDFFKSGVHPRGAFSFDPDKVDKEGFDKEIARLATEAERNPRGSLFLYGGKPEAMGLTNKDMEFMGITDRVRDRIIAVYGVPPQKLSIYERSNLGADQDSGADKNFWKKRRGEIKLVEDGFNRVVGRDWPEMFRIGEVDLENKKLRADIEDMQVRNYTKTINQIRSGYGDDDVPWGDTPDIFKPSPVPVGKPEQAGVKRFLTSKGLYYE